MKDFLRRHWLLLIFLVAGVTLRVLAWLAYRPALLYIDSYRYLDNLDALHPVALNPLGYTFVLKGLLQFGGLAWVEAVQHAVGVGIAVALYALARRNGVWNWLAALVAGVVLLDAYQLQIETMIMSEVWFQALLVGMLWVLLYRGGTTWRQALLAGLLVGAAMITRTIGVVVVVPLVLYLLVAGGALRGRVNWKQVATRCVAGLAGVAIVAGPYMTYAFAVTGSPRLSGASTHVAYGRAATIADCSQLQLEGNLRLFCPAEPLGERRGVDWYTHYVYGNPYWPPGLPAGADKQALADEFAGRVFTNQPLDLAGAVLTDFMKHFGPVKVTSPGDVPADRWYFKTSYPPYSEPPDPGLRMANAAAMFFDGVPVGVNEDIASFLRTYQRGGYLWGPALAVCGLLGAAAVVGAGRARRSGLRSAAFLPTASGLLLLLGSSAFEFSWRYQLPALVLLPIGGAIGLAALFGRNKSPEPARRREKLAPFPDETDSAAIADFRAKYGNAPLAPLTVVIAAYNEAKGIGSVLRDMPGECAGHDVSVLVVVDGATDDTAEVAERNGAFVCVAERNRGQGAALRLGYHLAAECGARYIVTTDADGQYDNGELPMLVKPLLDGSADFVTGSRRLGSEQADSKIRWLGVRVFAALATVLTLRKITDTSFGFRAMGADLATSVTLREPQYQSSELLLGVMARGARVLEVPLSMRLRNNGASKKGRSLYYGANYARVMTGTWLREFVLRRRTRDGRAVRTS
ncbi:glycosyltransferase involved in cell wall biosynthesis [Prauserella shujinwangii]|uniref:Glycosyltransferase involved in cell wall biosynthesis n=1 Tax=Prauserella shujinwangii TaxID=1453103 RepID=A0A2T0M0U7_9PSEU|nr:glycosyltransferase family 2 protein [Prauserella shujinwangii]PRX50219.1 glycosyltransferase involved in cell wall biosynthesis [Prauserella shujinwangii]